MDWSVKWFSITKWKKEILERTHEVFESEKKKRDELENLQSERDELFKQLGELKFQNEWYKKKLR